MPNYFCKLVPSQRGQSLTEFALMAPLLVLVLLGAVDLGRAYFAYVSITNAAREGARYGIDNPVSFGAGASCTDPNLASSTIRYHVCQEINGSAVTVANPNTDIVIECSAFSPESYSAANCSTVASGGRIRVTVYYTFNFETTQIIGLGSMRMHNYATMSITNGVPQ